MHLLQAKDSYPFSVVAAEDLAKINLFHCKHKPSPPVCTSAYPVMTHIQTSTLECPNWCGLHKDTDKSAYMGKHS